MRRNGLVRAGIVLAASLAVVTQAAAFVRDTHYDLTYLLSLSTCFDWEEAHLIASANFMVDRNKTTKAESDPFARQNKVAWHAFAHSGSRYVELWDRVLEEPDPDLQLIKFGQFLHFLQDWESHAGFGAYMGHAEATVSGRCPDSMATSVQRTESAAQATLDHMAQLCAHLDRLPASVHDSDEALIAYHEDMLRDEILYDLIDNSNSRWRKGKTGGLNRLGERILELNRYRIEEFIEFHFRSDPEKGLPDEFVAGEKTALPLPLRMRYDREGDLSQLRIELEPDAEAGDLQVQDVQAGPDGDGWKIRVEVENIGSETVAAGRLTLAAFDLVSEDELGTVDEQMPALAAGESVKITTAITASRMVEQYMISVLLDVEDGSDLNNFAWFTTAATRRELEEEYLPQLAAAEQVDEDAPIEVGFVEVPKVWVTDFGWLCTTVIVRTSDDDPTHVLDPMQIDFVDANGSAIPIAAFSSHPWSITPAARSGPPAVKAYECFPPSDFCATLDDRDPLPALRVHAEAGAGESEATVPLEGALRTRVLQACEAAAEENYVASAVPVGEDPVGLRVLTFNVWHGLRSGESNTKFPGEDEDRKEKRFAWQIQLIKRLDPDILLFQEVNPNQREARTYAEVLGYDEIHKVTSCGVHIGPIKIPKNVNEGLAILARPGLRLREVDTKRLSGNAACTASWGFQTKESRYVLLGEISVDGNKVLLATTHLSSPPYVPPGFEEGLSLLVSDGVLTEEQYGEITVKLERKRARNLDETRRLLLEIAEHRERLGDSGRRAPVLLGGDFNTEPDTAAIEAVVSSGLQNVATGRNYLTWDPVRNRENQSIGGKRTSSVPTFDLPEVEQLLAPRRTTARQIDYLFVSEEGRAVASEMVMDEDRQGLYPSDHFGIFAVIELDFDSPELEMTDAGTDQLRDP